MLCIIVPEYQSAADERAKQQSTADSGDERDERGDGTESQDEAEDDERFLHAQVV